MRSMRKERCAPAGRLFIVGIGVVSMLLRPQLHVSGAPMKPGSPEIARGPGATEDAGAALPTYRCRRTPRPIRADAMWDDAGWRSAASTGLFRNWDAHGVPRYPTEARLTYDDRALYIAFRCADRDIYSPYRNRDDSLWNEDVAELFLSLPDDPRYYYEFEVSPANVLFDARLLNPAANAERTPGDRTWNAEGIQTAVRVEGTLNQRGDTDRSWEARITLPFTALGLRRAPAPGTTWRANLYRFDASSQNQFVTWSPTLGTRPNFHRLERFGYLKFDP